MLFWGGKQILRARYSDLVTQTSCSGISVAIEYTAQHLGCLVELRWMFQISKEVHFRYFFPHVTQDTFPHGAKLA